MPVSPKVGFTYPTPLDPSTADVWGTTVNDALLDIDTFVARSYDSLIREQGNVSDEDDKHVVTFRRAYRLHNIDASTTTGTVDIDLKKNGSNIGGLAGVSVSSTQTETAVNDSSNAYIDFAAGDKLSIDKSSASSAENLEIYLDLELI